MEGAKVRPNIAAKERGPGPARYSLPGSIGTNNHDATMDKAPSYGLGANLGSTLGGKTVGPGPSYKPEPAIQKTGKDNTPKYTMPGRAKDFKTARLPGPGAYCPENVTIDKGSKAPSYTMRARTVTRKGDNIPASNTYALKSKVGEAPKYSMTGRSNVGGPYTDLAKAPGPGKYGKTNPDVTNTKQPQFTMRPRTKMPQDSTKKPGPGAHKIPTGQNDMRSNKSRAPNYSMGVRHSDYLTPLIVDVMD